MECVESATITFTCPKCDKEIKQELRWFKNRTVLYPCPFGCGYLFDFSSAESTKLISETEKSLIEKWNRDIGKK